MTLKKFISVWYIVIVQISMTIVAMIIGSFGVSYFGRFNDEVKETYGNKAPYTAIFHADLFAASAFVEYYDENSNLKTIDCGPSFSFLYTCIDKNNNIEFGTNGMTMTGSMGIKGNVKPMGCSYVFDAKGIVCIPMNIYI